MITTYQLNHISDENHYIGHEKNETIHESKMMQIKVSINIASWCSPISIFFYFSYVFGENSYICFINLSSRKIIN
jgi:hypothetical protein